MFKIQSEVCRELEISPKKLKSIIESADIDVETFLGKFRFSEEVIEQIKEELAKAPAHEEPDETWIQLSHVSKAIRVGMRPLQSKLDTKKFGVRLFSKKSDVAELLEMKEDDLVALVEEYLDSRKSDEN